MLELHACKHELWGLSTGHRPSPRNGGEDDVLLLRTPYTPPANERLANPEYAPQQRQTADRETHEA